MSLVDIKNHMMRVKITTLGSLCSLFNKDAETIRCMLSHWIRKGRVRQCQRQPECGSKCSKCPTAMTEMYEWVEAVAVL